jgi:hypothetical protein
MKNAVKMGSGAMGHIYQVSYRLVPAFTSFRGVFPDTQIHKQHGDRTSLL